MSDHTPGPWHRDDEIEAISVNAADGGPIATVWAFDCGIKMAAYNAKLISAAPDMLEILAELQEAGVSYDDWNIPITMGDRINEAIRKATT